MLNFKLLLGEDCAPCLGVYEKMKSKQIWGQQNLTNNCSRYGILLNYYWDESKADQNLK